MSRRSVVDTKQVKFHGGLAVYALPIVCEIIIYTFVLGNPDILPAFRNCSIRYIYNE